MHRTRFRMQWCMFDVIFSNLGEDYKKKDKITSEERDIAFWAFSLLHLNKMDTASLLDGEYQSSNDNLETFSLIWLDSTVDDAVNQNAQRKLRTIINYLKKFQNVNECQQYIEQRSKDDRLVIIVSGRFGREVVPNIHQLRQISSIYVFCMDKKANEKWANNFSKVKLSCQPSYS